MKKVKGDLIRLAELGMFDVIVHGCNCEGIMGSGIAYQIRREYPEAYIADLLTNRGDLEKLGSYSQHNTGKFIIVNGYTQATIGWGIQVSYHSIRELFKNVKKDFSGKRIGYPMIGAGLGGGDWEIISKIIDEELEGENHTFVIYDPS